MKQIHHRAFASIVLVLSAVAAFAPAALAQNSGYQPPVAAEPGDEQAVAAIPSFRVPPGFKVTLFAAEPMLANPVAFGIDERNRIYVCETYRQGDPGGVVDNRMHMYWLDDDLAAQTVADRRAMFLKHNAKDVERWTKHHDLIRLLQDTDGDGRADKSSIFADGFNDLVEGTGAGVLPWRGDIYYTCIPRLWLLRDTTGNDQANQRLPLHDGFGVKVAFRGHDLHGLVMGPDGKIYFSIGDRGYNVVTAEGKRLADPNSGAVFRCDRDGRNLEVIATGLRNPQELAFDDYGNLFTGDNNCDAGDQARFIYLIEGSESGWRMSYQYIPQRGPWMREGWWKVPDADHSTGYAAFLNPPLMHIANGPSGLAYDPGLGLPHEFRNHFFLCDFKGGAAQSGVHTFSVKPKGAGFEVTGLRPFLWNMLVTDGDFGYDGAYYVSDWVESWEGVGRGRIYRVEHEQAVKDPRVARMQRIVAEGMKGRPDYELTELIAHPHRRVRLEAQFTIADKGRAGVRLFERVIERTDSRLARLHAIWGLGQIGRKFPSALKPVAAALSHEDEETRAQAAKVIGDARYVDAYRELVRLLQDPSPRVQSLAAIAVGKLGDARAVPSLVRLLSANHDRDPWLRHAGSYALSLIGDGDVLAKAADDPSAAARMGVLLAMRRMGDGRIAGFLDDSEERLVVEAARAVNDEHIEAAVPALATLIDSTASQDEALLRRVINANYRLGEPEHAMRLASFAARADAPQSMRLEAIDTLREWTEPSPRERVLGVWRPIEPATRPAEVAAAAVKAKLGALAGADASRPVRIAVIELIGQYQVAGFADALRAIALDRNEPAELRVAALHTMRRTAAPSLVEVVAINLGDGDEHVRKASLDLLADFDPDKAIAALAQTLQKGSVVERQSAFETLARLGKPAADDILLDWLAKLAAGEMDAAVRLDLLEAAEARKENRRIAEALEQRRLALPGDDPLAPHRVLLEGGSAAAGRRVFWEKVQAQCQRCHKVNGEGAGLAGPDLGDVGSRLNREKILDAIIFPNREIAEGFDSTVIETEDGELILGILKGSTDTEVQVATIDGLRKIKKTAIVTQRQGLSPMPSGIDKLLTRDDLRDLVEYLAGLKKEGEGEEAREKR